jgi:Domain of unknown function (DUF4333)
VNPSTTSPLGMLALLVCGGLLVAGCSSTPEVSPSKLEGEISSQLEKQVGTAPDDVECPDSLTGKVGETQRCTLTAGSDTLGVDVEVTSVDGDDVNFDIQVDDTVQDRTAS